MKHILLLLALLSTQSFASLKVSNGGNVSLISLTGRTYSYTTSGINVKDSDSLAITGYATLATPTAVAVGVSAVDATANSFTSAAHGLQVGLKGQIAASSTFPAPLSATNYYIISISAGVVKLAASYSDALVPTPIDLTTAGAGLFTLTPQTFANKHSMALLI
jgi:hypothetical protein